MAKVQPATEVKTVAAMNDEVSTKRMDLVNARRGLAAGELANPTVIAKTRKEIARLLTAIRAAEQAAEGEK